MSNSLTRRRFLQGSAAAVLALTARPKRAVQAQTESSNAGKILNYNPDMEYRRCGKTNLMISAVCLGGHWKHLVKVIGGEEPEG